MAAILPGPWIGRFGVVNPLHAVICLRHTHNNVAARGNLPKALKASTVAIPPALALKQKQLEYFNQLWHASDGKSLQSHHFLVVIGQPKLLPTRVKPKPLVTSL